MGGRWVRVPHCPHSGDVWPAVPIPNSPDGAGAARDAVASRQRVGRHRGVRPRHQDGPHHRLGQPLVRRERHARQSLPTTGRRARRPPGPAPARSLRGPRPALPPARGWAASRVWAVTAARPQSFRCPRQSAPFGAALRLARLQVRAITAPAPPAEPSRSARRAAPRWTAWQSRCPADWPDSARWERSRHTVRRRWAAGSWARSRWSRC